MAVRTLTKIAIVLFVVFIFINGFIFLLSYYSSLTESKVLDIDLPDVPTVTTARVFPTTFEPSASSVTKKSTLSPLPSSGNYTSPSPSPVQKQTQPTSFATRLNLASLNQYPVSDSVKTMSLDCNNKSFLPKAIRQESYFCQNVYQINPDTFFSGFVNSGANRLLFYGQYSYLDCPVELGKTTALISKCANAALFLDGWQIPKMMEVMGVNSIRNKVLVFYARSENEINSLCHDSGASACYSKNDTALYLYPPSSERNFYSQEIRAAIYEGKDKTIGYHFTQVLPQNCFPTDVHEMTHYMNYQFLGYNVALDWFEEGMARLIGLRMLNELCPPGPSYRSVTKDSGGNQQSLNNFKLLDLDLEEPLTAGLESYAEGNSCRKSLYMAIARLYKDSGFGFLPRFYTEVNNLNKSYDRDFVNAFLRALGSPPNLQNYFREHGCDI